MQFVFDLDGTICFNGQPVSQTILSAIETVTVQGHDVIFASARPIRDMLPVIASAYHDYPMIGANGALIAQDGRVIRYYPFIPETLIKLNQLMVEFQATYQMDSQWNYTCTAPKNHPFRAVVDPNQLAQDVPADELDIVVKILVLTATDMIELEKRLGDLPIYLNLHHQEAVIDISPLGVNKLSALETIIGKQPFVVFGNDINDLPLFEQATHTVRIGTHESLTSLASETLDMTPNIEQAIATRLLELATRFA